MGVKRHKTLTHNRLVHYRLNGRLRRHPFLEGRYYCVCCLRRGHGMTVKSWSMAALHKIYPGFLDSLAYPSCPDCASLAGFFLVMNLDIYHLIRVSQRQEHTSAMTGHMQRLCGRWL